MPGGFSLELDTAESARLWHAAWRADPAGVSVVVGFSLPTREAVDQRYAKLAAAGGSARAIHSLSCPVGRRAASPRKSQTKSQRRPTSGDAQRRQATVKPGQVPTERH